MKRKVFSILLLASSLAAAWLIGYLNFPLAISSTSFWMGCTAALAIISLTVILYTVYFEKTWTFFNVRNVLLLLILTVLPLLIFFGHKSISLLEEHQRSAQRLKSEYSRRLTLLKNSSAQQQQLLFEATFEGLKQDLNIGKGTLSDSAIQKIVSFSASLKPYYPVNIDDSMLVSPERGKLLMGICQLPMDSNSFQQLIKKVDFSYADLRKVELIDLKLNGIRLEKAALSKSRLKNIQLNNSSLEGVNFSFSEIDRCDFHNSNMGDIVFRWATVQNTDMQESELNAMCANNANFINVNFTKSNLKWTKLEGTYIEKSNFDSTDLMSAIFLEATIYASSFKSSRLRKSSWKKTKIIESNMNNAAVEENWFSNPINETTDSRKQLMNMYKIIQDSSSLFPNDGFFLSLKRK